MPYVLGPVRDHVRAAAEDIGRRFAIGSILGVGLRANESDHPKGLALDFMTGKDMVKGQALANFVQSNASAYGVSYVIWNQKIWSVARSGEGWRGQSDKGNDTQNHKDHVHVSFNSSPGSGLGNITPGTTDRSLGSNATSDCLPVILLFASVSATAAVYGDNLIRFLF